MKQLFLFSIAALSFLFSMGQPSATDSLRNAKRDSTIRAVIHDDSLKVQKEFAEKEKWDKIEQKSQYPLLKGGKNSGVIPVLDPNEIPDPKMDYKLLFEVVNNNPDSLAKDIN